MTTIPASSTAAIGGNTTMNLSFAPTLVPGTRYLGQVAHHNFAVFLPNTTLVSVRKPVTP
jgi:hypothetical protein